MTGRREAARQAVRALTMLCRGANGQQCAPDERLNAKKPRLGRGFFFTLQQMRRRSAQAAACVGIVPAVRTMRFWVST